MDVYSNSKKGAQGIGTLIIFIAMILVAAVAAGVLIQTASSLQSKSLDVGRQTQERLTTDIEVVQVFATSSSGVINTGGDNVTFILRLGSGSTPVKLQDLLVRFDTMSGSQSLIYNGSANYSGESFGVSYEVEASNHVNGYLSSGDLAEVTFLYAGAGDIVEGETATLRLITRNGAVKPVQVSTPSAMTDTIIYLYP